jgi:glycerol-3-phosphate dehydrogenase
MNSFSFFDRENTFKELTSKEFDVLIVGGGITGAGIALDAASRGMSVALVEKNDFASGTSSKSTKLIHGGLRYLKQFDFWLVKEVGTERAIVHGLAPHLVIPEKMILPLVEGGTYGSWLTSIGLKVYDVLAAVEGDDKRKMLSKKEALKIEPLLPENILKGAGYYAEYRTDDARLTLELIKTSLRYGAKPINYVKVTNFLYQDGRVSGVKVKDVLTNNVFNIKSKYVINATGPWVDGLRQKNQSSANKKLRLSKGVHLVVNHDKFPINQSVYFDIPDGRMMFAIPRGGSTYFGTTDTNYQENKNNVRTSLVDAMYLISAVNNMFDGVSISIDDVKSSWAGLRPLIHEEGKPASELSRKDEIYVSNTELISVAGGKLTGYRKMAERIVDLINKKYSRRFDKVFQDVKTEKIVLSGGSFTNHQEVLNYIKTIQKIIIKLGLDKKDAAYFVYNYGKQTDIILTKFNELTDEDIEHRMIKAEVWFSILYESACSPVDFFMRRTGRAYFNIDSVYRYLNIVLTEFSTHFSWNNEILNKKKEELNKELKSITSFT